MKKTRTLALLLTLLATDAFAATIYVKQGGTGAGTSWTDAAGNLKTVIDNASSGDKIWVAAGTYKPTTTTDRTISFVMKNGVEILGGFPATGNPMLADRDWLAFPTVLSGDIGGAGSADNAYHVVLNNANGVNSTAVLDGFTITGGNANHPSLGIHKSGGGMLNNGVFPTLNNCKFTGNNASEDGGGIYTIGNGSMTVTNCSFSGNTAQSCAAIVGLSGLNCTFYNCLIAGNTTTSTTNTGVVCLQAGGSFAFINCTIAGNLCGAVAPTVAPFPSWVFTNIVGSMQNCVVWGNTTTTGGVAANRFAAITAGSVTVSYSDVQGSGGSGAWNSQFGSNGGSNIDSDPLFTSSADFTPQQCSPVVDAGNDASNPTSFDLANQNRKFDANPGGQAIDMGALESQVALPATPGPHTWTGATSTDWAAGCNWSPLGAPGPGDDATIPNTANKPVIKSTAAARSVKVLSGAVLTINAPGSLTLDGSPEQALYNKGTVNNSGILNIGQTVAVGSYGVFNEGAFNNLGNGQITIDRATITGVYNHAGTFTNSATLRIGATASTGHFGLFSDAIFTNTSTGQIFIDRSTETGLETYKPFTNNGSIKIGSLDGTTCGTYGLRCFWDFTNTGSLEIDRSAYTGLYTYDFNHPFINSGAVRIGSVASPGSFGVDNEGNFKNNSGGVIQIDRFAQRAFRNASGTTTNSAVIQIGTQASTGVYGLDNYSIIVNNSGAIITSNRPTRNSGTITNNGTITILASPLVQSGTFRGSGEVDAPLATNTSTGVIAPGNSPGCLLFTEDFVDEGNLLMEVGGLEPCDQHDKIEVGGAATISPGASLKVVTVNNAVFSSGDQISLLTTASLTGEFTSTDLPPNWSVVYTPTEVRLVYALALPVELGAFTAKKDGERVRLDWQTFSENGNLGFDVERSPDGLSFEKIGFLAGQGTTTERHDYLFFDANPFSGINYYRLRQFDFDARATFSPVASAEMGDGWPELVFFPNPVAGGRLASAMMRFNGGPATVTVSNAVGQAVATRFFDALSNEKLDWDVSGWPPGVYQMLIEQAGAARLTGRFVVSP